MDHRDGLTVSSRLSACNGKHPTTGLHFSECLCESKKTID